MKNSRYAYVVYSSYKKAIRDNKCFCPIVDPLINQDEMNAVFTIGKPICEEEIPSIYVPHKICWLEFIKSVFLWSKHDINDFLFLNRLYIKGMVRLGYPRIIWVIRTFLTAHYFSFVFRKVAIECAEVYVTCYYSGVMLGVVSAFRRLGKPVWDVQHGYIGASHPSYNNGWAWSIESTFKPTGFVVWDKKFGVFLKETLGDITYKSTDFMHIRKRSELVEKTRDPRPVILYTMDWANEIPEEIKVAATATKHVRWLFRKHPIEHEKYYIKDDLTFLKPLEHVQISDATIPLSDQLAICSLHITFGSSVVHEASILGVKSIFFHKESESRFYEECQDGLAEYLPLSAIQAEINKLFSA
jgi:hypothetical protein